jgi:adenylate cyclase
MLKSPDKLKLGGDKKDFSVLFSDIRGFTTISEGLTPEDLVHLLNEYLTVMTDIVFKYDGTLGKYMRDGVMAIYGLLSNNPTILPGPVAQPSR